MDNERKSEINDLFIEQLAKDILNDRVFTSRHVWYLSDEKADEFILMLRRVFQVSGVYEAISQVSRDSLGAVMSGILIYEYRHHGSSGSEIPTFETFNLLYGDELEQLDRALRRQLKMRVH